YGFWPANTNATGDDIDLYTDESRSEILTTLHCLRQQFQKPAGQHNHSLADFVAPVPNPQSAIAALTSKDNGAAISSDSVRNPHSDDYIGAFAVTSGTGADELAEIFKAENDDYNAIMAKALADRLAEAFAEYLHAQARRDWGFGKTENLTNDDLIREKYRGIRPAPGYPACPDHTEKRTIFDLLTAEENAGITLTESMAMHPGSSVSGLYFSHPEAKYFAIGKLEPDQIADYAARKAATQATIEKWLAPNIA
ncbi:MAG TPA: vitamin B12 dependent-methionine synthase activation domain-containing protein, partial [Chryseolinea sp.]